MQVAKGRKLTGKGIEGKEKKSEVSIIKFSFSIYKNNIKFCRKKQDYKLQVFLDSVTGERSGTGCLCKDIYEHQKERVKLNCLSDPHINSRLDRMRMFMKVYTM